MALVGDRKNGGGFSSQRSPHSQPQSFDRSLAYFPTDVKDYFLFGFPKKCKKFSGWPRPITRRRPQEVPPRSP